MKIAIVDDEKKYRDHIESCLKEININFGYKLDVFSNGESVIKHVEEYDIIFLDIELNDMLGVDIAKNIAENKYNVIVIFITSHTKYISDAFRYDAFQYLVKPINKELFIDETKRAVKKVLDSQKTIEVSWNGVREEVDIGDILYIENQDRKSVIKFKNHEIYSSIRLNIYNGELQKYGFVQTHNSYVINLKYMLNRRGYIAYLKNGDQIPISKKHIVEVKERFREYISGVKL